MSDDLNSTLRRWSDHAERKPDQSELGVEDELKEVYGISPLMLVVFGEHGIKSMEDLAGCATDDLHGWCELRHGRRFRHVGILDVFGLSREDCESIIIDARIKVGWIKEPNNLSR
jgi:N utilization substance protein A